MTSPTCAGRARAFVTGMRLAVLALASLASTAHADPATPAVAATVPATAAPAEHRFALAVNEPLGWIDAGALSVSGYGSIDQHQVIRLNVSSWSHHRTLEAGDAFAAIVTSGESGASGNGRYTTAGASWMYFPRRAYDGLSIELGALVQLRHTKDYTDDFSDDATTIDTTRIAGSAVLGWSWLGWDRVFASLQVGASVGRDSGSQLSHVENQMDVTTPIDRVGVEGEAFMRFGVLLN